MQKRSEYSEGLIGERVWRATVHGEHTAKNDNEYCNDIRTHGWESILQNLKLGDRVVSEKGCPEREHCEELDEICDHIKIIQIKFIPSAKGKWEKKTNNKEVTQENADQHTRTNTKSGKVVGITY